MLLAHLSDTHIAPGTPAEGAFERVLAYLAALRVPPDAVLVTGDLADHGAEVEYRSVARLRRLGVPLLVLPGNHDHRGTFRRVLLDEPPTPEPVNQVVRVGEVMFALCDSTVPGHAEGMLADATVAWLEQRVGDAGDAPVFVCFHHPPVPVGKPSADQVKQVGAWRLAEVLRAHPNVVALLCGHIHSAAVSMFAGVPVLAAPGVESTMVLPWEPENRPAPPPAVAFHVYDDGRLTTHYRSCP